MCSVVVLDILAGKEEGEGGGVTRELWPNRSSSYCDADLYVASLLVQCIPQALTDHLDNNALSNRRHACYSI